MPTARESAEPSDGATVPAGDPATAPAAGESPGPAWQARLAALEERVSQLEQRVPQGGTEPHHGTPSGRFWALEGLRERVPDGAVLFTGVAPLPTGEHYEWQQAALTDQLLNLDWAEFSGVLGALGHPVRLQLLRHVLGGARTVAQLQQNEHLGTTGQLYHHLRQLVAAGWLKQSGRGRYVVPAHRIVPLLVTLAAATPIDHAGPETPVEHSIMEGERQG